MYGVLSPKMMSEEISLGDATFEVGHYSGKRWRPRVVPCKPVNQFAERFCERVFKMLIDKGLPILPCFRPSSPL